MVNQNHPFQGIQPWSPAHGTNSAQHLRVDALCGALNAGSVYDGSQVNWRIYSLARNRQEILGHEDLETTTIYTHVSIGKLKEVHSKTHPTAKYENYLPSRVRPNKLRA